MARPKKDGLLYFSFDVDFFSDKKIKSLNGRYKNDGIIFYIYLLTEIYKNGYFIRWDEDYEDNAMCDLNLTEGFIKQVMTFLTNRSLLTSITVGTDTILTSPGIQKRYQEAVKSLKRDIFVDKKTWLLGEEETATCIKFTIYEDKSEKNNSLSEKNHSKSEKSYTNEIKRNESKGNEIKGNENKESALQESSEDSTRDRIDYSKIIDSYNSICTSLPSCIKITDSRKRLIRSRLNDYSETDLTTAFEKAQQSDFLSGRSGKWNGANIDWILNATNIQKILEGNYKNRNSGNSSDTTSDYVDKWRNA